MSMINIIMILLFIILLKGIVHRLFDVLTYCVLFESKIAFVSTMAPLVSDCATSLGLRSCAAKITQVTKYLNKPYEIEISRFRRKLKSWQVVCISLFLLQ